jgi:hypothetical protein
MITIAHIAGVPVEEFLTPLAGGMTFGMLLLAFGSCMPWRRNVHDDDTR